MNRRATVSATPSGKWFNKFGMEILDGISSQFDRAVSAVVGESEANVSPSGGKSRRTLSFQADVDTFQKNEIAGPYCSRTSMRQVPRRSVDMTSSSFLSAIRQTESSSSKADGSDLVAQSYHLPANKHRCDATPSMERPSESSSEWNHATVGTRVTRRHSRVSFDIGPVYRTESDFDEATNSNSLDEWGKQTGSGTSAWSRNVTAMSIADDEWDTWDATKCKRGDDANRSPWTMAATADEHAIPISATVSGSGHGNSQQLSRPCSGEIVGSTKSTLSQNATKESNSASSLSARRKSESHCRLSCGKLTPLTTTTTQNRRRSEACVLSDIPPCPPPSPDWILNYRQKLRDDFQVASTGTGNIGTRSGTVVGGAIELDMSQLTAWCEDWCRSGEPSDNQVTSGVDDDDDDDADSEVRSKETANDHVIRSEYSTIIYNPYFEDSDENQLHELCGEPHKRQPGDSGLSCDFPEPRHCESIGKPILNEVKKVTKVTGDDDVTIEDTTETSNDNNSHRISSHAAGFSCSGGGVHVVMTTVQSRFGSNHAINTSASDARPVVRQMSTTAIAEAGDVDCIPSIDGELGSQTIAGRGEGTPLYPSESDCRQLASGNDASGVTPRCSIIPSMSLTQPDGKNGSVATSPMFYVDVGTAVASLSEVQSKHTVRDNDNEEDDDDNSGSTEGCDGEWDVWHNADDSCEEELDLDPPQVGSLSRRFSERSVRDQLNGSASSSSTSFDRGRESMVFMADFIQKIFDPMSDITPSEKTRFNELCQTSTGRMWFVRSLDNQQLPCTRQVSETTFYRLIQFCTLALFECEQADDHILARAVMNLSFAFSFDTRPCRHQLAINVRNTAAPWSTADGAEVLYGYVRHHTAWNSLRFWTAAYFDAVQQERALAVEATHITRERMENLRQVNDVTNSAEYLGMFVMNMRTLGLSKSLCIEFVRKQAVVTKLTSEQIELLKDNIEKSPDVAS